MERTFVLPDPTRPYERVDLVWINTRAVHLHLVAGTQHPQAPSGLRGTGEVPLAARSRLLAAFNGGFKRLQGRYNGFGFRAAGQWYLQPTAGLATLAVYRSYQVALGTWGTEIPASPAPWSLLQNLDLLVDHGRATLGVDQGIAWGITVGSAVRVWRSGLALTGRGNLVYAAGVPVTARTLARVFTLMGVRRAMQLDINSYWVTFNFYRPVQPGSSAVLGTALMSNMVRPGSRYLSPDSRDFVYITAPGPAD